jgi:hypothetical protein
MWGLCAIAVLLIAGVLQCDCAQSNCQELSLREPAHLGYEEQPSVAAANVKRKKTD